VNHEDIVASIEAQIQQTPNAWFHAGEFSDSLALSHLTDEWKLYFDLFRRYPQAQLELRTKSTNIKSILSLDPSPNIHITFSLSPRGVAETYDRGTPGLPARLKAIGSLVEKQFQIGIHLDPIMIDTNTQSQYESLIEELTLVLPDQHLSYLSLGVVRFTDSVWHQVKKNYPESPMMRQSLVESFDGKWRAPRPMRQWHLGKIKDALVKSGYDPQKIYYCME
jgi:spore photoproduct lyase